MNRLNQSEIQLWAPVWKTSLVLPLTNLDRPKLRNDFSIRFWKYYFEKLINCCDATDLCKLDFCLIPNFSIKTVNFEPSIIPKIYSKIGLEQVLISFTKYDSDQIISQIIFMGFLMSNNDCALSRSSLPLTRRGLLQFQHWLSRHPRSNRAISNRENV